jgi:hypothetical protein
MKKYSSYKTIKPLNNTSINTTTNNQLKMPSSPTHSTTYRKLGAIDLSANNKVH